MPWIRASKYGVEVDPTKTYTCRLIRGTIEIQECHCLCHNPKEEVIHYQVCCMAPVDGRVYLETDPIRSLFQWDFHHT